ncbi:MAG: MFS transporter [Anaerolineales bacterium]|nr:MFS transporter [Anaerolineales bacterium]
MNPVARFWSSLSPDLRWITIAIFFSGVAEGLSFGFQTLYVQWLGATPAQIGLVFGAAGLVTIAVYVPAGWLADRWRRKPIILAAWLSTLVTFTWLALAPDWRWAVPGFMLYALGSFSRPAFSAYIAAGEGARGAQRAFAITSIAWSLGNILAPALGGWIGEHFGLRLVFALSGVVYIISTLALLPLSNPASAGHLSGGSRFRRLFANRQFLWQVFAFMLIVFAMNLGMILAPNYLQAVKGISVEQVGLLGTAAAVGLVVLNYSLGRVRPERRSPLILLQLAIAAALGLLLLAPPAIAGQLPALIIAAYLLRSAMDGIWTPMSGRLSLWLPPEILSLGFSLRDTGVRVAMTLAPLAAGRLYALDPALPLQIGLGALAVTVLLTLTLPNYRPAPAE